MLPLVWGSWSAYECIQKYKLAIEKDPEYAPSYLNWGFSLANLNRLNEAIEKYKLAIEKNPKYAVAYLKWGLALIQLNSPKKAMQKFVKAKQLDPNLEDSEIREIISILGWDS